MKRMKGHEGFKAFFSMIFMSFMVKIFLPKKTRRFLGSY